MLYWIFGEVKDSTVSEHSKDSASGILQFEKARVNWSLSINGNRLPVELKAKGKRTYRTLTIDGEAFEFSEGFTELHTRSYEEILKGNGFPIIETKPSIEIVQKIRNHIL